MITFEQAQVIQDRLLWDGTIEPYNFEVSPARGRDLDATLQRACGLLVSLPALIVMPWEMCHILECWQRQEFDLDFDKWVVSCPKRVPGVKFDFGLCCLWGHVGTYRGIDVLCNHYAEKAWVTSASNPKLIDGTNTRFVHMEPLPC